MYIADRNVYGCDLNPVAVELAEVSLWLNTIYKGAYVPWFGTQLVNGNSLIGARRQVYSQSQLEAGKWYEKAPRRIMPGEERTKKGQHENTKEIYHFLLGDPGMANYTDKVIKNLDPDNIKKLKAWNKDFTSKFDEDELKTVLRLSESIDRLWKLTADERKRIEEATSEPLSVYGHEETGEGSHKSIREKDEIYKKLFKSEEAQNAGPYARLKAAMDYWCALWFWPIDKAELLPSRQEFFFDMSLILEGNIRAVNVNSSGQMVFKFEEDDSGLKYVTEGDQLALEFKEQYSDLGEVCLDDLRERSERLLVAKQIAEKQKFHHWELEFADIFDENGGFDLTIGNPPWLKVTWNEQDILSEYQPEFVIKKYSAQETSAERNKQLEKIACRTGYFREYESVTGIQTFINSRQNYLMLQGLQANLYECFLPIAINNTNKMGVFAFIHPETIFNDSNAMLIREMIYPKLRKHFRFSNALKLFPEVHTSREFGLNIYSNSETNNFENIFNLYSPSTIDEAYEDRYSMDLLTMKNDNGKRELRGNKNRIINVGKTELQLLAKVVDGTDKWKSARLLVMQLEQYMDILKVFDSNKLSIGSLKNAVYISMMWDETNAQKAGIIKRNTHFASDLYDCIISGNHIGIANPLFNTPRENCSGNNDTDSIDLTYIDEDYLPRSNYQINGEISEYVSKIPETCWGECYTNYYRIACRKMIDCEGARTLMCAIIPPKIGHTNGIIGFAFENMENLLISAGLFLALPIDFFVKLFGKSNFQPNIANVIPYITDKKYFSYIKHRVLMLNCVSKYYTELWESSYEDTFNDDSWLKQDERLTNQFSNVKREWTIDSYLKSDYERRQALVELDVIVSKALGMTLEQLKLIYKVQFSTLRSHEKETWYDMKGRIVFTNNRSLTNVGLSRKEWEAIKESESGTFSYAIVDNTSNSGSGERKIVYYAPFIKCDREMDYDSAWQNFEKRLEK